MINFAILSKKIFSFFQVASSDINSHKHADYAGLLVLIEYFTQTEGPLWEAVRGPGYAYSQSIHINPDKVILYEQS